MGLYVVLSKKSVALCLAVLLAGGLCLSAQKSKLPGEDWVSLFNGVDLTGWTKVGQESWTVEDNVIHGKGLTAAYGYLETDKDYKDFQLSLRFKCVGDGNSGVFFHTGFKPGSVDTTQGMQFEIDCKMMHHTGGVYGEDGRGWIVLPAPEERGGGGMGEVGLFGRRRRTKVWCEWAIGMTTWLRWWAITINRD